MSPSHNASSLNAGPLGSGSNHREDVVIRGSETVVNPERRPAPIIVPIPELEAHTAAPPPSSSLVRVLFPGEELPHETAVAEFAGLTLGHFEVRQRIRSGGMGAVFEAIDTRLNRIVALKVLPPHSARDLSSIQRFQNEARAAAQLDHENIARVFYIGEDQGLHFIAFEFIHGTNLRELIQQVSRLDVAEAVNFTLQIASALVHMSELGVVHRDIKPSNIIITPGGRAKLVDLGLARTERRMNPVQGDLTLAGTTLGTFDYISPEQARDPRTADVRSDIYSLGCTLYHMLTGHPPYPDGTVLQKLLQHQGEDAPDPAQKNGGVPENLSAVVRKMMAKDPRRRYQSANDLMGDLMLVAGSMRLQSMSPEGLVWMSAPLPKSSFWERHLGWIVTVAALFGLFAYMEYDRISHRGNPGSGSARGPLDVGPSENGAGTVVEAGGKTSSNGAGTRIASLPGRTQPDSPTDGAGTPAGPRTTNGGGGIAGTTNGPLNNGADRTKVEPITPIPLDGNRGTPGGTVIASNDPRSPRVAPATGRSEEGATGGTTPAVVNPAETEPKVEPDPSGSPVSPVVAESEICIVTADGIRVPHATLEAACAAAVDGSVIELRFNGTRVQKRPLRVSRRTTIRAVKNFNPHIEFRLEDPASDGDQARMITITSGSLDLIGVDATMVVDNASSVSHWSLFLIQRPEHLRLNACRLAVEQTMPGPACLVEVAASLPGSMADMEMPKGTMRPPPELEWTACFIRGDADLLLVRSVEPLRITIRDSLLALGGVLFNQTGSTETPAENAHSQLKLDHVTALVSGGVLDCDVGDIPRRVLPLHVSASNSIFTTAKKGPLVAMRGNASPQMFRSLLSWSGQKNFYDRFETAWVVKTTDIAVREETNDFAAWQKIWGASGDLDSRATSVAWKSNWTKSALHELTVEEFLLDETVFNPAVAGATNGTDLGADLSVLHRTVDSPVTPPDPAPTAPAAPSAP